ncbi:polyprenyl synthetase family protein [Candidatus Woesearchaeota archaeon]|jgi:geranylgeranyl pyrophosphate synthase|nr:polyprenyl synthetase family protein [Candidatus Woesearchaeota archaeon]MBT3538253.1 polyprenyl synthetase family protein [Candidatus Woesearchaeota archaeon]MBT4697707.1 polyprenyl synthetase family protein [Candidatus Woesearchaeota archaeon]MBT4717419.1 polyprenyl synthetase family protein [Candidatus Woesearchaeota archaeon]MBT7105922.1 polyprenyl synthetase family protein [Candidatus Woesearchaeota archaeon]
MKFNEYLAKKKKLVDEELAKFLPHEFDSKSLDRFHGSVSFEYDVESLSKALCDPIWDLLDRGGKRWRPALMLLFYELLGGKDDVLKYTVIPEILHNGTLLVDDIEDSSELRRGKPCVHKSFGVDVAINAGNSMYFLPFDVVLKSDLDDSTKNKIYELISTEMMKLHSGQALDIWWHKTSKNNVSVDQYCQMCAFKTGTLARLSAKLGVVLANGSVEDQNVLSKFAERVGVAFQIKDDILNIKPSDKWGKDRGDDITEGKMSLLVIRTLDVASDTDKSRLLEILGLHTKDVSLINEAIEIILKYDSVEFVNKFAKDLVEESWLEVSNKYPESSAKTLVGEFASYLIDRDV